MYARHFLNAHVSLIIMILKKKLVGHLQIELVGGHRLIWFFKIFLSLTLPSIFPIIYPPPSIICLICCLTVKTPPKFRYKSFMLEYNCWSFFITIMVTRSGVPDVQCSTCPSPKRQIAQMWTYLLQWSPVD